MYLRAYSILNLRAVAMIPEFLYLEVEIVVRKNPRRRMAGKFYVPSKTHRLTALECYLKMFLWQVRSHIVKR